MKVPLSVSPKRISTWLMLAGLIVMAYPLLTEAYGVLVAQRMRNEWTMEAQQQEKRARADAIRQAREMGKATFANEDAILQSILDSGDSSGKRTMPQTKIRIPKIGLEQVIVPGVGVADLEKGPGFYPASVTPGQKGNVLVAGHRVTYTKPFYSLDELKSGDLIVLETLDNIYEYRVAISKVTSPQDTAMLEQTDSARLTMTTCTPRYSSKQRLDVQAVLASSRPRQAPSLLRRIIRRVAAQQPDPVAPTNAYELAVQEARAALDADPHDPRGLTALGRAYETQGRPLAARRQYEAAIRHDNSYASAHYRLAILLEKEGDKNRALDEYQTAVKFNPSLTDAAFSAGELLLDMGRLAEAQRIFEDAVLSHPYSSDNHYLLGRVYEKTGEYDKAEAHYREALRFVPDLGRARDGLARVRKKLPAAP